MKSILFVPATRIDLVEKASKGAADAVCLDLEDGVAPDQKATARANLPEAVGLLKTTGRTVALRINSDLEHISYDLQNFPSAVDYIVLPMTGSRHHISQLSDWADRFFGTEGPKIIAMIETPGGVKAVAQSGSPFPSRLTHLALGTEDFAADVGCQTDAGPVQAAFNTLSHTATEWGLSLLGYPGSIAEFRELDRFRATVQNGSDGGAVGGFAIHPQQINILNDVFAIDPETLKQAELVVSTFERALAQGLGVVQLDGRMIDQPVYEAARKVLQRA